jgi:hypothetical protein
VRQESKGRFFGKVSAVMMSAGCAAILLGTMSAPAKSETEVRNVYTRISGPELQVLMQNWGFRAELSADNLGDPKISSKSNGVSFTLYTYGCDEQAIKQCTSVQLAVSFDKSSPLSVSQMNEWNKVQRYSVATLDDEGDPRLKMDVNVDGGVTEEGLRDSFDIWEKSLGKFLTHIDW